MGKETISESMEYPVETQVHNVFTYDTLHDNDVELD